MFFKHLILQLNWILFWYMQWDNGLIPSPEIHIFPKTIFYWFIKNGHIYIYNNQPSNLFPNPVEEILSFPSFGLWSDWKSGNMVKCCTAAPWEGHLLNPFPC